MELAGAPASLENRFASASRINLRLETRAKAPLKTRSRTQDWQQAAAEIACHSRAAVSRASFHVRAMLQFARPMRRRRRAPILGAAARRIQFARSTINHSPGRKRPSLRTLTNKTPSSATPPTQVGGRKGINRRRAAAAPLAAATCRRPAPPEILRSRLVCEQNGLARDAKLIHM